MMWFDLEGKREPNGFEKMLLRDRCEGVMLEVVSLAEVMPR